MTEPVTAAERWFLARCETCDAASVPSLGWFSDRATRDEWATEHQRVNYTHVCRIWEEAR